MNRIAGYARITPAESDAIAQCAALEKAGCFKITVEKASGLAPERPKLEKLLADLTHGDALVVARLDRLGLSLAQLGDLLRQLGTRGIALRSLEEGIDTASDHGDFVLGLIDSLSEFERSLLGERTQAGMDAARKRGVRIGRPFALTQSQINHARSLVESGEPVSAVARTFGVNRATLNRAINRNNNR